MFRDALTEIFTKVQRRGHLRQLGETHPVSRDRSHFGIRHFKHSRKFARSGYQV